MARTARMYGAWLDEQLDLLRPGLRAVDVGCGVGDDSALLVERGLAVTAVDLDRERIGRARQRAPGAAFVVADLRGGLPFVDAAFDLAVASLSLHYFDHATTARLVAEVARVVRRDGWLLCRVNVVGDTRSLWGAGRELEPDVFEVAPGQLKRFFTAETLRAELAPWFAVEEVAPRVTLVGGESEKQTLVARARRAIR